MSHYPKILWIGDFKGSRGSSERLELESLKSRDFRNTKGLETIGSWLLIEGNIPLDGDDRLSEVDRSWSAPVELGTRTHCQYDKKEETQCGRFSTLVSQSPSTRMVAHVPLESCCWTVKNVPSVW